MLTSKYIDLNNEKNLEELKNPAKIINDGGIVVFPTETVYGIGTNGLDENAVRRLYKVKQRPIEKPISLLVSNSKKEKWEVVKNALWNCIKSR